MARSRWFVFTGRSCSGITTTMEYLRDNFGYKIFPEMARIIIDEGVERGLNVQQIRRDEAAFQNEALRRKLKMEKELPREDIILLDRGVPDSVPYGKVCGLDVDVIFRLCEPGLYQKVFFLEPLDYQRDYARTETDAVLEQLDRELRQVYVDLDYEVISVPAEFLEERVKLILPYLKEELKID